MNKIKVAFLSVFTVALIGFVFFNNINTQALDEKTQFLNFGKLVSNNVKDDKFNQLKNPATLNKNDYESLVSYYKIFFPEYTAEQVEENALNTLIEEVAVISKAAELNMLPTENEVVEKTQELRKNFDNATGPENEKVKEMVKSLAEGLGITEEEYWNTLAVKGQIFEMSAARLFEQQTKDVSKELKSKEWEESKQQLIATFKEKNIKAIEELKAK